MAAKVYGKASAKYPQKTVKRRIEALFLENLGKVLTRETILLAAKDPVTGLEPENWHQRLSELRTDDGYTIRSWRDTKDLTVGEYVMPHSDKRAGAGKRVRPTLECWAKVLERAKGGCEWNEGGQLCGLKEGEIDPIGGGTVKLTPDHNNPHSINPNTDPSNPTQWRALCGRHQVVKKNFWDSESGKLNIYAIIQAAPLKDKKAALEFLLQYFGYEIPSTTKSSNSGIQDGSTDKETVE